MREERVGSPFQPNGLQSDGTRVQKLHKIVLAGQTKSRKEMVRPERFELPTFWFVARRSIQLS